MIQIICDLDGVVYRGTRVLPGVPEAMRRLRDGGGRFLFVTNNSTRTPDVAAAHVTSLTGVECHRDDLCTSPQAAALMLGAADWPVFVVGEEGIDGALAEAGHAVTSDATEARSVVVGLTPRIDYDWIARAATAVRRGARFVATNVDPTYPIENGLLPGAGSIVEAIATAAETRPEVAGKPHRPMVDLVRSRLSHGPVWVVGDRLDTDIALATAGGWESILVLGGVTVDPDGASADHVAEGLGEAIDLILRSA